MRKRRKKGTKGGGGAGGKCEKNQIKQKER